MKHLGAYIHDLLIESDCISIPGFGGLLAQNFHAELNSGTHLIRPKSKRISFHQELSANAYLLVNKITTAENCTSAKAEDYIANTVAQWQQYLAAGESVKVAGVGRFYLDYSGAICFNQSLESNLDLQAFGFDIFRATAIKREIEIKETMATAIARQKQSAASMPFWRAAAVFTGIGALLAIALLKSEINMPTNLLANFNPLQYSRAIHLEKAPQTFVPLEEIKAPATTIEEEELPAAAPEVRATPESTTPIKVAVEAASLSKPYHVIVGSFKDITNAQELLNKLTSDGYSPTVINDGSAFAKVSLESFDNREKAAMALRAYKLSVNKGAWIYTR